MALRLSGDGVERWGSSTRLPCGRHAMDLSDSQANVAMEFAKAIILQHFSPFFAAILGVGAEGSLDPRESMGSDGLSSPTS